jgi:hypothetical protein
VEVLQHLLGGLRVHVAAAQQELGVLLAHRAVALDLVVHQGLGVARLVALVVAVLAVAHHVDDHVLLEDLPEVERQAGHADGRLGSSPLTWKMGAWIIRAMSVA